MNIRQCLHTIINKATKSVYLVVRGMHDMHEKEGKMDEKKIFNYVIPLAEDGFEVDSELERSLKIYGSKIDRNSPSSKEVNST